jgi:hypothetical protein
MTGILKPAFQGYLNHRAAFAGSFEDFARTVEPHPFGEIRG